MKSIACALFSSLKVFASDAEPCPGVKTVVEPDDVSDCAAVELAFPKRKMLVTKEHRKRRAHSPYFMDYPFAGRLTAVALGVDWPTAVLGYAELESFAIG